MSGWYIVYNGQQVGPMTKEQLLSYGLNSQSKVWREGMSDWADVYTIPELMEFIARSTPNARVTPAPTPTYVRREVIIEQPVRYSSGKSKVVAGILAILLGTFGVQYFYINKPGAGILSFLLIWVLPTVVGIVTCGGGFMLYLLSSLLWLLYIGQGIEMLVLSDEEFDARFPNSSSFWPFF